MASVIALTEKVEKRFGRQRYRFDGDLEQMLARIAVLFRNFPVEEYGTEMECLIWMGPERGYKAVVSHEADERR